MEKGLFKRSKNNPILVLPGDNDEVKKIYNPGVWLEDGIYHFFPRVKYEEGEKWKTEIHYYRSSDGEKFHFVRGPILHPPSILESRGLEDPRISKVGNTYFMTYTGYDGNTARYSLATSHNLKEWEKNGPIFPQWDLGRAGGHFIKWKKGQAVKVNPETDHRFQGWLKAGGIFPERINGNLFMIFGQFTFWIGYSNDGRKWSHDAKPFIRPRPDMQDSKVIEMGPPPIKTEKGWLVLYNGVDHTTTYRLFFLLLDLENPRRIIYRSGSIFEPRDSFELSGFVDILPGGFANMEKMNRAERKAFVKKAEDDKIMPRVVFCNGAVIENGDTLRIYYGAGDTVICTATASLNDILSLAEGK